MPRQPSPWYREARNAWYVKLDRKQRFLGEHPSDAPKPKQNDKGRWNAPQVILDEFHKLMLAPTVDSGTVWQVFDAFLEWTQANRAPRTYEFYQERLQRFKDAQPNMAVEKLKPDHVYQWMNPKTWSDTYKHGVMTALQRAFNWAVKCRKITFNPIKGIEKPQPSHREQVITTDQFKAVIQHVNDEAFRDLLQTVWLTGCRPQEVARVEARHVHKGFWRFPKKESKGKKRERVVFLVPKAEKITKKWASRNPEGPIFRNNRGRPWTAMAFNNRFRRLTEKVGFRLCMYAIRHSYAHHALTKSKLNPVELATLLGHADLTMIHRTYGHLLQDTSYMMAAAKKVRG